MAGLYFHIPFCKRLCGYCDFYRSVKLRHIPDVIRMMHTELERESGWLSERRVRTIYFGGGTPSLLAPSEIQRLIDHARTLFDCSGLEEITIEVNPDDVTEAYVEQLRATDVNRVSLGVQSLDDEVLRFMGRRHSAAQAVEAVGRLQRAGYDNLSVDLIFGVEPFGEESLRRTIEGFLSLGVQHISAYHLTIEPDTRFGRLLSQGALREVDDERSEREYRAVHDALTAAGFDHYEVSNYALDGRRSRHNSSYWTGDEYLGIGPGAHSFARGMRRWSEQSVEEYAERVEYGSEVLTERDRLNEYVMVSLRRAEGISVEYVRQTWGAEAAETIVETAQNMLRSGWLQSHSDEAGEWLAVPAERFLVSDAVISTFFEV
jgi:oxygen-independent coproporphyrinogen-3 oxidase